MINCVCGIRSTGRICTDLADRFIANEDEVRIAYGRMEEVPEKYRSIAVQIGGKKDLVLHVLRTRLLDQHGFGSGRATARFLRWAEEYQPDLLWLHNIHGYYINVEMLFYWIKRHPEMQVNWTLHDCWAFTGHCAYFTSVRCDQWKKCCQVCPQLKQYPKCYGFSSVCRNYDRKKRAFTGVPNMKLITPSKWLADRVEESFLKEYKIEVQYNKINKGIFKPTKSNFRVQYGILDRIIVLGVASTWDDRKGLSDFCQLAKMLSDRYIVVLVGVSEKQIKRLPKNVLGIKGVNNAEKMAEIYTAANIYVNLSIEETFGMTNMEAMSCGTSVLVYEGTACEEAVRQGEGAPYRVCPQQLAAVYDAIIDTSWYLKA